MGSQDGQLPDVGDTTQLFNRSWNELSRKTIKCWVKSNSVAEVQVMHLNSILIDASSTIGLEIDLTYPIYPDQVLNELPIGRHVTDAIQNILSEMHAMSDTPRQLLTRSFQQYCANYWSRVHTSGKLREKCTTKKRGVRIRTLISMSIRHRERRVYNEVFIQFWSGCENVAYSQWMFRNYKFIQILGFLSLTSSTVLIT